jgi:hypothetical protein
MSFLDDFPDLDSFLKACPELQAYKGVADLLLDGTTTEIRKQLVDQCPCLGKYPPGELVYGAQLLFGWGKGYNNRQKRMPSNFILKHHADVKPHTEATIARSLELARNVLRGIGDLGKTDRPLLGEVLGYHFKVTKDEIAGALAPFQELVRKLNHLRQRMEGCIRIAEAHGTAASGFVRGKQISQLTPEELEELKLSPFKTASDQYVYGSIHVYVPYFSQDVLAGERYTDLRRAQLIIHEASHKFCYTDDHAYANDANYQELSQKELLDNADSFGYAAVSLHAKRLIRGVDANEEFASL